MVMQSVRPCLASQGNSEEWERRHLPFPVTHHEWWIWDSNPQLEFILMSQGCLCPRPTAPLFWSLGDSIAMYQAYKEFWFQNPDPCEVSWFSQHTQEESLCCTNLYISSLLRPRAGRVLPLDNGYPLHSGYDGYRVCTVLLCVGDHGFFLLLPHSCFIFINQLAVLPPTEEFSCPSMPCILLPPYTPLNSVLVFIFLNSPVSTQLWSFGDSIHSSPLPF